MPSQKAQHELGSLVTVPSSSSLHSPPGLRSLCVINCHSPGEGNIQKSAPRQCIAEA